MAACWALGTDVLDGITLCIIKRACDESKGKELDEFFWSLQDSTSHVRNMECHKYIYWCI